MPKNPNIKKVLVIGSGPIIIGQACEFDYSGTQACKALRGLGYKIVLVNSNPATIMTDPETADVTYIEPLNVERLTQIIEKERPDALLPNLGGQSALNLCSELSNAGVLDKYDVQVLGVKVDAIERGEDRLEFKKAMNELGIEYTEEIGEAAFYGPKLDVNVKPAIGNEITLSTCQLDFCLPAKFNLTYVAEDGTKKTPVVLHRAILGSLDRFMAYILEETKGNLPLWLAPVQAKILPVKNEDEELNAYSHDLYKYLDDSGIRVEIDERNEKLGYRIREAQMEKVPYLLVLGKNEAADGTVSYRLHGEQNSTTVSREDFLALLKEDIRTKKINPAALK